MKKILLFICFVMSFSSVSFGYDNPILHAKNEIREIQKKQGGIAGVYTIDRNNWTNFSYNESFYFPICSTYKFLLVGAILKEAMNNPGLLDEKLKVEKTDIVGYSPITEKYIDKKISVKQLCKAAILSDNTAANLLIKKLGGLEKLREFGNSLNDYATKVADYEPKINHVELDTNLNKTTPKIMARDINKLAFSDAVLDKKHRLLFKKWLKENDTGENRIAQSIPKNWKIGDKTGTCEYGTTNDVAIIFPDDRRAISIAIFYTQADKTAKPSEKVIRKIARIVMKAIHETTDKK